MHIDRPLIDVPAWYDLLLAEPDAVTRFYGLVLGWTFEPAAGPTRGYRHALRAGHVAAGLGRTPPGTEWPAMWNVYFGVTDIVAKARDVTGLGGEVLVGPLDVGTAGRLAYCVDPTGTPFGLWQAGEHRGVGVVEEPGAAVWAEINTRDAVRASAFYAELFTLTPTMSGPAYVVMEKSGRQAFGVLQMGADWPAGVPAHWVPYFGVPDVDLVASAAEGLGGVVALPPTAAPFGRIAVLNDPAGAVLAVLTPGS